jgi:hypothetical protein
VSLTAVPASALDSGQLAAVGQIYAEAFPPELRVPFADLDDGAGAGGGLIVALDSASAGRAGPGPAVPGPAGGGLAGGGPAGGCATASGGAAPGAVAAGGVAPGRGTPAGFASLRRLDSAGAMFVRYFAVAGARRRQGTGRRLWQLLPGAVPDWPGRVVFEVEDPADTADPAEQQVRRDRIAFWRSCGTELLPVPEYVMPDLTGAGTEPMLLLAAPACAGEQLRRLVQAIYTDRYGLAAADPLVRRALASVPD